MKELEVFLQNRISKKQNKKAKPEKHKVTLYSYIFLSFLHRFFILVIVMVG